jgi:hypothetical protein
MKVEYDCKGCAGRGSNFGQFCPDCNGTGIASDPKARRLAFWLLLVLHVLATVIWLKACT